MRETSSSLQEEKEHGEEEEGEGSEVGLDDLVQQTAPCEDFRLHMTTLAWLCHPASSA